MPGTPGGAYPNNGGNTYQGATKDTITIVDYVSDYGAEVNAILQAEGLLETYDDAVKLDKTFESFINQKYVLFGRKVHIIPYKGQCQSVPPQKDCLLPEMDRIVDTYHPYIVFWPTTLCSECYAELARKKTVAIGGVGFSDEFTNANAPYFYSSGESATHIEQAFAQFWCAQMSSVNVPSRTVKFAEHNNPAQDFNGQKRVLGVISTNDPDNENTVKNVLVPALKRGCNEDVTHFYFYDQDINTAAKQVAAGIAAMDTPQNPATSVLCLCDPVAPAFLYNGEQSNNYYPENVLADVQGMGYDNTGQSYGANPKDGSATLGCPNPKQGCEFDNAVGLIESEPDEPAANDAGLRIFHVGGGQGDPPTTPLTTTSLAKSWVMMGNLLEATGLNLTPANMQAQAPAMGTLGGAAANVALLGFSKNDWNWTQDARIVYWNAHKTSAYNGLAGTYVSIEGSRYNLGAYPSVNDGPPAPTPDKRT